MSSVAQERVFSEQEVAQIIRRAVELTEESPEQSYTPGVTRAELERIASEVGVSSDALQRAILEAGERKGKRGLLNLTAEFERVVEGELDPGQFDLVIEGLKPLGNVGQPAVAQVGRLLTMSAWNGCGQARIDVSSRNGRTKLKVKSNALFQMLMALYPGLMATIITIGALSERGQGWLGAAIGIVIMTLATLAFFQLTRGGHRRSEKLADEMRDRIARAVVPQSSTESTQIPEPEPLERRLGGGT